ncbi:MAG TPA: hypothetical protein VJH03_24645 [Blastocatellia bacterium]|nr:hypothetical protein [Blastocatellia bacterium]
MKPPIHKGLAEGRWFTFSIFEQLGNVGSEFERAAAAHQRGDRERFEMAFDRMLELLDLTIEDPKWRTGRRLRELLRLREEVCDVFYGNDTYGTSVEALKKYFLYFGIAARAGR